jgi:hypothetical protein
MRKWAPGIGTDPEIWLERQSLVDQLNRRIPLEHGEKAGIHSTRLIGLFFIDVDITWRPEPETIDRSFVVWNRCEGMVFPIVAGALTPKKPPCSSVGPRTQATTFQLMLEGQKR